MRSNKLQFVSSNSHNNRNFFAMKDKERLLELAARGGIRVYKQRNSNWIMLERGCIGRACGWRAAVVMVEQWLAVDAINNASKTAS